MTLFRLLSLSVLIVSAGNTLVHASASEYEDTEQYDLAFRVSYPYYELPLTDQDFSGYADSFGIEQFDTLMPPITDPSLLEQLASLHLGASDSGFFNCMKAEITKHFYHMVYTKMKTKRMSPKIILTERMSIKRIY
ncbi:hypothetical protein Psyaliredsea_24110 [Psychrobacter alimentarius]